MNAIELHLLLVREGEWSLSVRSFRLDIVQLDSE